MFKFLILILSFIANAADILTLKIAIHESERTKFEKIIQDVLHEIEMTNDSHPASLRTYFNPNTTESYSNVVGIKDGKCVCNVYDIDENVSLRAKGTKGPRPDKLVIEEIPLGATEELTIIPENCQESQNIKNRKKRNTEAFVGSCKVSTLCDPKTCACKVVFLGGETQNCSRKKFEVYCSKETEGNEDLSIIRIINETGPLNFNEKEFLNKAVQNSLRAKNFQAFRIIPWLRENIEFSSLQILMLSSAITASAFYALWNMANFGLKSWMASLVFGLKPVLVVWPSVYLWFAYTTSEDMAVDQDPTISNFFLALAYIQLILHLVTITLILVSQSGYKTDENQKKFASSRFWRVLFRLLIQYPIISELIRGINILAIYFYYTRFLFPGQNADPWNFIYLIATFIFLIPGILSAFQTVTIKLFPHATYFQFYRRQWQMDGTNKFQKICCQCAEFGFFMRLNYYIFEAMKGLQLLSLTIQFLLTSVISYSTQSPVNSADLEKEGFEKPYKYFAKKAESYANRLLDNTCSVTSYSSDGYHVGPVSLTSMLAGKCMFPLEWFLLILGILGIALGTISLILLISGFDPTTEEYQKHLDREPSKRKNEHSYLTEAQLERTNPKKTSRRQSIDVTAEYNGRKGTDSFLHDRVPLVHVNGDTHSDNNSYVVPNQSQQYNRRFSNDSFETMTDIYHN